LEWINLANSLTGLPLFTRNLDQTREGGCDVKTELAVAVEIKRTEKMQLNPWYHQVTKAALEKSIQEDREVTPVIAFRGNSEPWANLVVMNMDELAEYITWRAEKDGYLREV